MQTVDYFKPAGDSLEIEVINAKDATVQSYWKDDNMSETHYFKSPGDEVSFYSELASSIFSKESLHIKE